MEPDASAGMWIKFRSFGDAARHYAAGWLVFAFFIVVFSAILLLISALQLQHAVAALEIRTKATVTHATIGQVRADVDKLDAHENELTQHVSEQIAAGNKLRDLTGKVGAIVEAKRRTVRTILDTAVQTANNTFDLDVNSGGYSSSIDIHDYIDGFVAAVAKSARDQKGTTKATIAKFRSDIANRLDAPFAAYDKYDQDQNALNLEIDNARGRVKALMETSVPPLGGFFEDPNYASMVEDFRTFRRLGNVAYRLLMVPNAMLVLLLSICMGMLGSLIYLARLLVVEHRRASFTDVVFRVGLGAGVALALYFFAAAGMLALTPASGMGEREISPYLIAFIGITAGYLSERATEWMADVGSRTLHLARENDSDRWATHLSEVMLDRKVGPNELAKAAQVPLSDIVAWLDLKKPVSPDAQKAVSLYLRVHRSRIFTDLEPAPDPMPLATAAPEEAAAPEREAA